MKLSVTTLGWPKALLDEILADIRAAGGFTGIDFRGIGEHMDLTQSPAFGVDLDRTVAAVRDAGLVISGLSTSTVLIANDKGERKESEVVGFCNLADRVGSPMVRIFGGRRRKDQSRQQWMDEGVATLTRYVEQTADCRATICVETHDDWCHSADVAELLDRVNHPRAMALWDVAITSLFGGESPATSAANLAPRIRYTHIKDGVMDGANWKLTLPGEGKVDIPGVVAELKRLRYDGWFTFEWEKRWHPEIPDARVALPVYRRLMESLA